VPAFHIRGLDDRCYHYDGGRSRGVLNPTSFLPVSHALDTWIERNHCRNETVATYERGAARCRTYQGCTRGADVTLCTIDGGGHMWPGRDYPGWLRRACGGDATNDLIANDVIWDFFAARPAQ
jgi:polyhydroxybutyrate depolymerase